MAGGGAGSPSAMRADLGNAIALAHGDSSGSSGAVAVGGWRGGTLRR